MCRVALFALLAAACSGVAADPVGHTASPLQGGTIDGADRATVGITTHRGAVSSLCSGSLIAPDVVVTARHCIAQVPPVIVRCGASPLGASVSPAAVEVTTELTTNHSLADDAGASYAVASIELLPGGDDACGYNLARLVLASPVAGVTPYAPSFSVVRKGDPYSAIGYGETCGDASNELCYLQSGTRRRIDGLSVACTTDCDPAEIAPTEWGGQKGLCTGDSGGPALDADGRLIGIALRGALDADGNCIAPVYAAVAPWPGHLLEDAAGDADSDSSDVSIGDATTEPSSADAPAAPAEQPAADAGCACTIARAAPRGAWSVVLGTVLAAAVVGAMRRRLAKRVTVYLEPEIHRALRLKSVEAERSVSDLVNDAVRQSLNEDADDLASFRERAREPALRFEQVLKDLRKSAKL